MRSHVRIIYSIPVLEFLALLLVFQLSAFAAPPATPAGHWEGEIKLPGTKLAIQVDLAQSDDGWKGTIDIPVQGLRGFELNAVAIDGTDVRFVLPNIPGDPTFSGKLTDDGQSITGDFAQAGQKFPFTLARKERAAATSGQTPDKGIPGKGLAGFWQGSLRASAIITLRLALEITDKGDGKSDGVLVSLDQGDARIPLTASTQDDGSIEIQVPLVKGTFVGTYNADGSELSGTWEQNSVKMPLVFKRLAQASKLHRPQDPKKPYPYTEEQVLVEGKDADVKLAGTFTVPSGAGPHPAVVFITGSGPQDRDEAIMGHRPFLVLADHLTRRGIAVLRYDDRGIGKSTGDFSKATHADFVQDALAAVDWLKSRKEIDPERIGLVGHSEGGVVAPLAAVERPDDVAFIVLLAGVGVPMKELLVRQTIDIGRVMGQSDADIEKSSALQRELLASLLQTTDRAEAEEIVRKGTEQQLATLTDDQRAALGLTKEAVEVQAKLAASPWFRHLLAYDPGPVLRQVKCPVLALNGEKDLQVASQENLAGIRDALASGGNQDVTTIQLPDLNHLFQHCTTGAVSEYGEIEETFSPEALDAVSNWIREHAGL